MALGLGSSGLVVDTQVSPPPSANDPTETDAESPPPQSPSPNPQAPSPTQEDNDDLPSVGRVWEGGGATSIFSAFKKSGSSTPTPPATGTSSNNFPPDNITSVDRTDFDQLMSRFHQAAAEQAPTVAGFLDGGKIIALEAGTATVEYPKNLEASARMLDRNGKRESLQEVLSNLLGQPVGIKFSISDQEQIVTAPKRADPRPQPQQQSKPTTSDAPPPPNPGIAITDDLRSDLMKNNPLLKALAEQFDARIVKVE